MKTIEHEILRREIEEILAELSKEEVIAEEGRGGHYPSHIRVDVICDTQFGDVAEMVANLLTSKYHLRVNFSVEPVNRIP